MAQSNEEKIRKRIKKLEIINYLVLCFFLLLICWAISFKQSFIFTPQRWKDYPDKRSRMVADFVSKYDLVGYSDKKIISLLGEPTYVQSQKFTYYLGDEGGIISIDSEWLVIEFNENFVINYYRTTD